jgi:hypothetical protein
VSLVANVRWGSNPEVVSRSRRVRSTPNNGHAGTAVAGPFGAGTDSCAAANCPPVSRWNGGDGLPLARPRQYDLELSEKSELCLDVDAAAVLFYDDVVAHRQAKPGTFAGGKGSSRNSERHGERGRRVS